jgi:WXG100 family type VII secretion target
MGTLHVDTDLMRQLGQVFVQLNDAIQGQTEPQIQGHVGQLEGDWQGVSRQRFELLFQDWRTLASQLVVKGDDIGHHLQNTATMFEQADQS